MQELDLASPLPSADMPYLCGNQRLSVGHEAILAPAAGKGKLPVAEGFMETQSKPASETWEIPALLCHHVRVCLERFPFTGKYLFNYSYCKDS